jgi:glucan biosynthesis protein C
MYIDNLRNLAVLALILFHTGRLFDSESWHMKDAVNYPAADLLIGFFNPWHMPLLFLLAGMSSVYALQRRGVGQFIGERFSRLFVPFVVGVFLAVLPQVYLERISPYVPNRASPIDFDGSVFAFVPRFLQMVPYPDGDFSWHHLWFLIYLLIYSILLAPLLWWMARSSWPEKVGAWLAQGAMPFLLLLPLVVIEVALRPAFPSTHALINDWADHANFITVILIGALLASAPALVESIAGLRWVALASALVAMFAWLGIRELGPDVFGAAFFPAVLIPYTVAEWLWIMALLGFSRVFLNRSVTFLTAFTRYALAFYVFHQAVIIWLGWLTFGWSAMPFAKFVVIAVAAAVISYGLARLSDLTPLTRFLIGLKAPKPAASVGATPAGASPGVAE